MVYSMVRLRPPIFQRVRTLFCRNIITGAWAKVLRSAMAPRLAPWLKPRVMRASAKLWRQLGQSHAPCLRALGPRVIGAGGGLSATCEFGQLLPPLCL